ncbi:MAG: S8 family serine peptidase [Verrucomicrobiia bacterium]
MNRNPPLVIFVFAFSISMYGKQLSQVSLNGNYAHPTRIIACYNEESRAVSTENEIKKLGFVEKERFKIVPGLRVIEEEQSDQILSDQTFTEKKLAERLLTRIEMLKKTGLFKYVEPDWIKKKHIAPNDTAFVDGRLWGLRNTGQNGGVPGADINAVSAWNITTGTSSVIVAIIDSGVRYTHSDLAENMWRNPGEIPGNGIDDDNNGYVDDVFGINAINGTGNPADDDGHGTHVAGIIGAAANNGQPNVGVAWKVRIMACKFLDSTGAGKISDEIKCIDYAISKGAKILNMSFGDNVFSQAEFEALNRAFNNNILVVASAGNESVNNDSIPTYPANYNLQNIISVAAFNRYNQLADFSNYGQNSVHIAAPGESIFSCWNGSDYDYKTANGTSMAAPYVTGVAALVASVFPDINVRQLRSQILQSAVQSPAFSGKLLTGGRIDASRALNGAPDGILEISITPDNNVILGAGTVVNLIINVSDLYPVTNAIITGILTNNNTQLTFSNFGTNSQYISTFQTPTFGNSITLSISITAPSKIGTNFVLTYSLATPPSNDDFYKSSLISNTTNIVLSAVNTLATKQPGEPDHSKNSGGKSLWWSFTPNLSGLVTINTDGSDFDTLLAVYTGNSITNLRLVVANDDYPQNSIPNTSRVYFYATNNTTYHIAVDGYSGSSGNIRMSINLNANFPIPLNDNFANRIVLNGYNLTIAGTNIGATAELNEPLHAGKTSGSSVWYSWTAPFTGNVSMDTSGSDFDTILAVYTGNNIIDLVEIVSNDDVASGEYSSKVQFYATQGIIYQIAIAGYESACGKYYLTINKITGGGTVPNDMFTNAITISQLNSPLFGSNIGATKENGEPNHAGNSGGASVWYKWTAPSNSIIVISTEGSDFDTLLAVYTGSTLQNLVAVASNDDDYYGSGFSKVTFNAISNQTYYIAIDGYAYSGGADQGIIKIIIQPTTPPINDNFENRTVLSGIIVQTTGSNLGATAQASEPYHSGYAPSRSVWWQWTAPISGYTVVSTEDSEFDTLVAVYTGTTLSALTPVAGGDDDFNKLITSRVFFYAQAGTTYQIAVDGYNGSSGKINLRIAQNLASTNIYYTGFRSSEGFVAGGKVAGVGGWQCNFNGGNGILANRFPNKDQQAYIGYSPTYGSPSGIVLLWRPINYVPPTNSIVIFSVYMSIVASTDGYYDNFGWSVYNSAGIRLFTIDFDNNSLAVSYSLDDNQGLRSADLYFENNSIYQMTIVMDFSTNQWSAYLNGVPIAEANPITTQGAMLDLGDIDARWVWGDLLGGDNFMIFDEYKIEILTELKPPTVVSSPQSTNVYAGGSVTLSVQATGALPLYYQWYYNGNPIIGAVSTNLTLLNLLTNQSGVYSVTVSNLYGTALSEPATLIVSPKIVPPQNDNFSNRLLLSGETNIIQASNNGATREPQEPFHCGNAGGKSIWFRWIAPTSGRFTVSTVGSDFDTLLAIYTGGSLTTLSPVASNDDAQPGIRTSLLWFDATKNTEYQIAIDGFNGASGNIILTIKPFIPAAFVQWYYKGGLGFYGRASGEIGIPFTIQTTTNLKDWLTLTNSFNSTGVIEFRDTETNSPLKFYRVIY